MSLGLVANSPTYWAISPALHLNFLYWLASKPQRCFCLCQYKCILPCMNTENWTQVFMIAHPVPYRWSHLPSPLGAWGWHALWASPILGHAVFLISPSACNPELSPQRWSNSYSKEKSEIWELEPMGDRHGGYDLGNLWDLRAWLASTICIQKFVSAITTHIHHWHIWPA